MDQRVKDIRPGGRKSLKDALGAAGFQMPEMPGGYTRDMASLGKDPVTGEMRFGSSSMRDYYKQLDDMYAQNPEALKIAKQYRADQTANPDPRSQQGLLSRLRTPFKEGFGEQPQPPMQVVGETPRYDFNQRPPMPRAITGREQLMRRRSPVYQGPVEGVPIPIDMPRLGAM
tara:strand:- start:38 stop:553 length:516 start_codon:yes stop_codon:yes gene_type:complete